MRLVAVLLLSHGINVSTFCSSRLVTSMLSCWLQVSFGQHSWQLPRSQRPHPDAMARRGAFAAALLVGRVLPAWQPLAPLLVDKPSAAAAAHARHVPRVGELLAALTAKQVTCCLHLDVRRVLTIHAALKQGAGLGLGYPLLLAF